MAPSAGGDFISAEISSLFKVKPHQRGGGILQENKKASLSYNTSVLERLNKRECGGNARGEKKKSEKSCG